jgi:cytochrome c
MRTDLSRKKSVYIWRGALLWLLAILTWQSYRHFSQQPSPQAVVQSHLASRQAGQGAVLATCAACHSFTVRENRIGPPLVDLVGKRAGTAAGFAYSEGMRGSGLVWDRDNLRKFLIDPVGTVPGTAMAITGVSPEDAQVIIGFLENNK